VSIVQRIQRLVDRVMQWKPVRVVTHYTSRRGPLLAAGLSYQAIFAVFAAIWVAFATAGFVIRGNPELLDAIFEVLSVSVPGLINTGDGGVVDPDTLLQASILGWTGAIAAGGLLITALGWLGAGRDAVRTMFRLPALPTNFFLVKLRDFGLAVGFGIAIVVSAGLTVLSTAALTIVFQFLGIDGASPGATIAVRGSVLLVVLVLDTLVLGLFYREVSGIRIPFRYLWRGSLLGGLALGVLKALGSTLLGGASHNPLLASFAVILGMLIWFNFTNQAILLAAAWISVSATDDGVEVESRRRRVKPTDHADSDVGTAL
jgi:membrane protein